MPAEPAARGAIFQASSACSAGVSAKSPRSRFASSARCAGVSRERRSPTVGTVLEPSRGTGQHDVAPQHVGGRARLRKGGEVDEAGGEQGLPPLGRRQQRVEWPAVVVLEVVEAGQETHRKVVLALEAG